MFNFAGSDSNVYETQPWCRTREALTELVTNSTAIEEKGILDVGPLSPTESENPVCHPVDGMFYLESCSGARGLSLGV